MIRPLILCIVIASMIARRDTAKFVVQWNVPTYVCHQHSHLKDFFVALGSKYNITQNTNDTFRGNTITLLYDPGLFPTLVHHNTGNDHVQNGGLPQLGNLSIHEMLLNANYSNTNLVKNNFSGLGIIDFESSRPVLQQNWGTLKENKRQAYKYECDVCNGTDITIGGIQINGDYISSANCSLNTSKDYCQSDIYDYLKTKDVFNETAVNKLLSNYTELRDKAAQNFLDAAAKFMGRALEMAKNKFPQGKWGYYGYPYCYNMNNAQNTKDCPDFVKNQNDKEYKWLFNQSTGLYPSVYIRQNMTIDQKRDLMEHRVKEAMRVSQNNSNIPVFPYTWYKYNEKSADRIDNMSKKDIDLTFKTIYDGGASGLIIWGSSEDLNNQTKCETFKSFIESTLGDIMRNYTSKDVKEISTILRQKQTKM